MANGWSSSRKLSLQQEGLGRGRLKQSIGSLLTLGLSCCQHHFVLPLGLILGGEGFRILTIPVLWMELPSSPPPPVLSCQRNKRAQHQRGCSVNVPFPHCSHLDTRTQFADCFSQAGAGGGVSRCCSLLGVLSVMLRPRGVGRGGSS